MKQIGYSLAKVVIKTNIDSSIHLNYDHKVRFIFSDVVAKYWSFGMVNQRRYHFYRRYKCSKYCHLHNVVVVNQRQNNELYDYFSVAFIGGNVASVSIKVFIKIKSSIALQLLTL